MNTNPMRLLLGLALCAAACSSLADGPGDGDGECDVRTGAGDPLVINEIMASNGLSFFDDEARSPDWLELYNPNDHDVSLCSYSVTTDLSDSRAAIFTTDVTVPAGGHLVVWMDDSANSDLPALPLHLEAEGGEVGIAGPDGEYLDRVTFGAQATDFSAAREPDGSDNWVIEWHVSPGAANPEGDGQPLGPEDPSSPPEAVPAAGELKPQILGYDVLLEIEIRVDEEGVNRLRDDPYTYVPGYLVYDGREYGPVGVRLKGSNSFRPIDEKPSFRINVDEYADPARFFRLDDLTLNNMTEDFSMMHERLAYLVARQVGPASRSNHAVVTFNGEFYGLYANVEPVKWHMLTHWFDDYTGPLFEGTDVDFEAQYIDLFEHDGGPDDRSMLRELANALTLADADQAITAASSIVEMDQFRRYWAMTAVLGQFDGMPYSMPGDDFFVYADPQSGRLYFMPWGMDETFYSSDIDPNAVSSVLARKCVDSPSCYQAFVDEVWATVDLIESMDLSTEVDRVAAQIAPYVSMDTKKAYDNATVSEFQQQLRFFINGRRQTLSNYLPPPSQE